MKNEYKEYTDITKKLLDSIKVGDLIKVNDWGKPLRVMGVSENYFVMATKQFKDTIYSVCEKKSYDGYNYNDMIHGMFHCGRDSWICGWLGFANGYDFNNSAKVAEYLQSFEDENAEYHSEISPRSAIPIRTIKIKNK